MEWEKPPKGAIEGIRFRSLAIVVWSIHRETQRIPGCRLTFPATDCLRHSEIDVAVLGCCRKRNVIEITRVQPGALIAKFFLKMFLTLWDNLILFQAQIRAQKKKKLVHYLYVCSSMYSDVCFSAKLHLHIFIECVYILPLLTLYFKYRP